MTLDIEAEVQKLKEHSEKPWRDDPDLKKSCQEKLDFINDAEQGSYRMFSVTLDYFATGEGRTTAFVANGAYSKREFLNYLIEKMQGYWYVIGMNLYEGMPKNDAVFDYIFSDAMKQDLDRLPYFELNLHQHYNFS